MSKCLRQGRNRDVIKQMVLYDPIAVHGYVL